MDKVRQIIGLDNKELVQMGVTGKGITSAILDTGISPHPDLMGRIKAFVDMVNEKADLYDDSGHGTHVAGILAGNGKMSDGIFAGIAPESEVVSIKVLDENGDGEVANILKGIQWIAHNYKKYGIRIVNLSAGSTEEISKWKQQKLLKGVNMLWDLGLIVVVSAGNNGPEAGSVAVPGNSHKVITVGSIASQKKNWKASGVGPTSTCVQKPDVVAPGCDVISCNKIQQGRSSLYTLKSGTSMAAPIVSGCAALWLSAYLGGTNVEFKLRLRETSKYLDGKWEQGWGCINPMDLILKK